MENRFTNPASTFIFGDTVVFVQWAKEPLAIRIQNSEIAQSHQNAFNLLWKNSKK